MRASNKRIQKNEETHKKKINYLLKSQVLYCVHVGMVKSKLLVIQKLDHRELLQPLA